MQQSEAREQSQQYAGRRASDRSFFRARMKLRTTMVAGLLTLVPLAATFVVLRWVLGWMDSFAAPLIRGVFHVHIPGLGILLTLVAVYLVGFVATSVVGKRMIDWGESTLMRVPVVKTVYNPVKKLLGTFALSRDGRTWKTVLVEYPRRGAWMVAFVAGEIPGAPGEPGTLSVFIPNTPNPASGRVIIVPRHDVRFIDMTIEEAIQFVVSGGTAVDPSFCIPASMINGQPGPAPGGETLSESPDAQVRPQSL